MGGLGSGSPQEECKLHFAVVCSAWIVLVSEDLMLVNALLVLVTALPILADALLVFSKVENETTYY